MLRIRIAFCALVLVAGSAHAAIDNAGTTAGNFLSVGTGAGILSMGGATLATGQDLNAAAWNPALLARLDGSQFALSHSTLAAQSTQEWLGAGGRVGRARTRWAVNALYQGDGSFDGRDAYGASTGSFAVSSMALGLQFAQPLGEALTAGVGAHWLADNLGDAHGHGLGVDAGLQALAGPFGIGAAVRNVGGSMQYATARYDLPAVYGVGASWTSVASGLRLAVDANFPHAYYNDVRVGGEWRWQDRLALRAGYRLELGAAAGEPLGGPSFGLGAGANGVWMDYAFLASGAQEQGQHRLGLTFRPGFLNHALRPMSDAKPQAPPAPVAVAAPARIAPAPARTEPVAVAEPAPAPVVAAPVAPAPVADALTVQPSADALEAGVAPRALTAPASPVVRPSRAVRVSPLVMPTRAELAQLAAQAAPIVASAAPAPAHAPRTRHAAPAAVPTPVTTPAPVAAASAPVQDAPAPALTPAPAPVTQVASSAPRIVVVSRPADSKPVASTPAPAAARPASVTVAKGETLADIARKWHTSTAAIMMLNNLVREDLTPGQKLKLPTP